MEKVISVKGLTKSYRVHSKNEGLKGSIKGLFKREYIDVEAVKNISFEVDKGEIIGFIGPNGAGKTTTIKMLSGLIHPTDGEAEVLGYKPWERKNMYLKKISLVMGNKNQLWWDIPALDSFILQRDIYQIPETEFRKRVDDLAEIMNVEDLLKIPVRNLSLGQRMKMEIIGSILHNPEVLFLDEPTIGLDMIAQKALRNFIKEYNVKYGTAIILTSHYMADIESLCKRIIIINHGEIVYDGNINNIKNIIDRKKIIKIQFSTDIDKEQLKKYEPYFKDVKDDVYVYNVEPENIYEFVSDISRLQPHDISIEDQPLEDIVENFYIGGNKACII